MVYRVYGLRNMVCRLRTNRFKSSVLRFGQKVHRRWIRDLEKVSIHSKVVKGTNLLSTGWNIEAIMSEEVGKVLNVPHLSPPSYSCFDILIVADIWLELLKIKKKRSIQIITSIEIMISVRRLYPLTVALVSCPTTPETKSQCSAIGYFASSSFQVSWEGIPQKCKYRQCLVKNEDGRNIKCSGTTCCWGDRTWGGMWRYSTIHKTNLVYVYKYINI